jgi:phenylpropionate dioxygenase-like ring-hydroxylating dioxygenase large terminal subunit
MALTAGIDIADDELIRFQAGIIAQDIAIVESQRPELLPLDLQAELHLRSDRLAIAYRKWLQQLGLTFGTA